jgi:hypothetical protein
LQFLPLAVGQTYASHPFLPSTWCGKDSSYPFVC